MILVLAISQAASRVPFDDRPELVLYARLGYIASQLLSIGVLYLCAVYVKRKNDETVLKYAEPKGPMSHEPGELVVTTNRDYDLMEIQKSVRLVILSMVFVAGLHLYWSYTQPLLIQSILPLKSALQSQEVKIWIWGKPATGELKRPFKSGPGLFGQQASQGPQTDRASIKEAEAAAARKSN